LDAVYFRLGFEHLLDLRGYDHLLFLAVLCAPYSPARWRQLLVLVTAFTAGHSVALALATLDVVRADAGLVEFLIMVTVIVAAAANCASASESSRSARRCMPRQSRARWRRDRRAQWTRYALALGFGLVHGLGFSNFLRLALGRERSLLGPLLSFNIGLEIAQIVVVAVLLAVAFAASSWLRVPDKAWNVGVSALAGGWAFVLAVQRWPW